MTHENQLARLFDIETGQEDVSSTQAVVEAQAQLVIEQGNALEALRPLPGWKLVEDFCYSQIEAAKEKLLDAKDLDEIRRLQSLAAAFSNLLGTVDTMIREATELKAEQTKQEREQQP
jgi:hypothetical protein